MTEAQTIQAGERLVRAVFTEVFNDHDVDRIDRYFSAEYAHDGPVAPGREGFKAFMAEVFAAFPDLQGTIEEVVQGDGKVAVRSSWSGTHRGTFLGVSPTGRRIEYGAIEIFRVEDGVIVGHHQQVDNLAILTQLGLLPEPGLGDG